MFLASLFGTLAYYMISAATAGIGIGQLGYKNTDIIFEDNTEDIDFDYKGVDEYEDYGAESKLRR